jgi:hypothetical protein
MPGCMTLEGRAQASGVPDVVDGSIAGDGLVALPVRRPSVILDSLRAPRTKSTGGFVRSAP